MNLARELTLKEYVDKLPDDHLALRQYVLLMEAIRLSGETFAKLGQLGGAETEHLTAFSRSLKRISEE